MPDLLGAGLHQHIAILDRPARSERLEELLEHHADLALNPANRLLEHPGEYRIGLIDPHRILQLIVVIEHPFLLDSREPQ